MRGGNGKRGEEEGGRRRGEGGGGKEEGEVLWRVRKTIMTVEGGADAKQ